MVDYAQNIKDVAQEVRYWFAQLLGLEQSLPEGNLILGKRYGIITPSQERSRLADIRSGFQEEIITFSVVYLFSAMSYPIAMEEALYETEKLKTQICKIQDKVQGGKLCAGLRLSENFQYLYEQQLNPPRLWEITITTEAYLNRYVYKDSEGRRVDYRFPNSEVIPRPM